MTRINVGMKPMELCDKHLLAEAREMKRIPNVISRGRYSMKNIPEQFTLNKGHVKFFYDKQLYLLKRYKSIHTECIDRGFNVQDFSNCWDGVPASLMNDYVETPQDRQIIQERINERLSTMKNVVTSPKQKR